MLLIDNSAKGNVILSLNPSGQGRKDRHILIMRLNGTRPPKRGRSGGGELIFRNYQLSLDLIEVFKIGVAKRERYYGKSHL
jgi:hypothetical protein